MRPVPPGLRADLEIIRCATARRGGPACSDYPCQCTVPWRLTAGAAAVLRPFTRRGTPTAAQRAALADWLEAASQEPRELARGARAPARFSHLIVGLVWPGDSAFMDPEVLDDLDRLRRILRAESDDYHVPSRAVVVEAIRWVRANLCRPPRGQPAPGRGGALVAAKGAARARRRRPRKRGRR